MKKHFTLHLSKACLLMLFVLVGKESLATTYYVKIGGSDAAAGTDWTTAFATVQKALTTATSGDQIWVAAGTYYPDEGGSFADNDRNASFSMKNGVAIYGGFAGNEPTNYDLSLRNFTTNETTLSGEIQQDNNNSNNSLHIINNPPGLNASAILNGFTVTGGYANGAFPNNTGGGMFNHDNASPTVANCTFVRNIATNGGGMWNNNQSSPSLSNCIFSGNSANDGGGGMLNRFQCFPSIANCVFLGNKADSFGGGLSNDRSSPNIVNCTFSGNSAAGGGGGMYNFDSSPSITNTIIWNNRYGASTGEIFSSIYTEIVDDRIPGPSISFSLVQNITASGSNIYPLFVTPADPASAPTTIGDLRLQACSPAVNVGTNSGAPATDILGNARVGTTDMGAYEYQSTSPTILYVNQAVTASGDGLSWTAAFKTLQEALQYNCPSITQIWVAKGTYYPDEGGSFADNDRNAAFVMKSGVSIYGGFVGNEASDYDLSLRNFTVNETILSGDIDKDNSTDAENAYHVIFNNFTSGTPLTNTAVLDGFTIKDGYANGSAPNSSGAGMYNNYASPIVRHCKFTRNTIVGICYGGGMYNANSSPQVSDCTFTDNIGNSPTSSGRIHGIGMYNNASSPTITNCAFTNNSANDGDHYSYGGGIENENSSPVISGCTFTDHTTTFGPGIFNRNSPLSISNCTFTNNQVYTNPGGVNGSGINTSGSTGTITSCRFINNGGVGSIGVEGGALVEITRCSFSVNRYGIALVDTSPNISNCLFTSNSFGGVVVWYGASTPVITNCTFSENPGSGLGSISNYGDNSPILKNCIIWGSGNSVYVQGVRPAVTITNSIVKQPSGVYTGTGNLNVDPLFANSADPDGVDNIFGTSDDGLRLQACSPAINAGDPATTTFTVGNFDLAGNARIQQNIIDLGAYESPNSPLTAPSISGGGTVCQFGASPQVNFTGFGGTRPYTFSYSVNNGPNQTISSTAASSVATLSASTGTAGNFTFTLLQVTDANGCQVSLNASNTANVSITSNPAVTASSNAPVCVGSQLNLSVSGGTGWTWSGPNGFSNNAQNPSRPSATTAMSGVYSVTVSTANGCTQVATTQVTIGQLTTPQISSNSPLCVGGTLRLSVTGAGAGVSYSWGATVPFSSTLQNPSRPSATVAMSGTYSVTVTGGCSLAILTTSVVVSPNVAPSITSLRVNGTLPNAQNTVAVCNNAPVTLTVAATNTVTYSWRGPTGAGSGFTSSLASPVDMPISTPRQGQYTVTVRNGCQVFNQRVINIQLSNCATRLASAEDTEPIDMEINAYPNPVSKTLRVEVRLKEPAALQLKLLNSVGQERGTWQLGEVTDLHRTELDLSKLTGGVYLLEAQAGKQRAVKRVVKIQYE